MVVVTALTVMLGAVLAQHMGLTEAMARIASKVAKCPKCCTFWSCLAVLWLETGDALITVALSLLMSYAALWTGFLFAWLNTKYNEIWRRISRRE